MIEPVDQSNRAPYYDGRGFPLNDLSAEEFENFVFSSLLCIQDLLHLRVDGKPSGSGDGGFDVQGELIDSPRLACVQCKRQKSPLDTPQVAKELAKVAATAALEGSDIGAHRFICTGGVRKKLRGQLREKSRRQLAAEAAERLANAVDGELISLRRRLEERGLKPQQVAESYVLGLDTLVVWDTDEFDAALSPRWDEVLKVAERHFRIATVVREHPRASFDRAAYVAEYRDFKTIFEPLLVDSLLPESIVLTSSSELHAQPNVPRRSIKTVEELSELEAGELSLLLGQGGAGKSTVLALLRAESLRTRSDSTLPVLISLATYVPGGLDEAIHRELGVDHGTWHSLPDRLLLLCDGLNECSFENAKVFLSEIVPLLKRKRVSCVLATRESATYRAIHLPHSPVACVRVQTITPVVIRRIVETKLGDETSAAFMVAYRTLADRSDSPHLWTPFSVLVALRLWQLQAALPSSLGEMLETLLRSRCARDSESSGLYLGSDVVLQFAGALAFQCLIVDGRLECPALEAGRWIKNAKKYCEDAFGIAEMTDTEAVALLTRHELLNLSGNGHFRFGHQLLAGALAAPVLANVWQQHAGSLGEPVADDAWVFAARMVPLGQADRFLEAAFDTDLMLGARVARELPSDFHLRAERLLERAIAPESPETVRARGLFALARLGTFGAIARLREVVADKRSPLNYAAKMSLAATGDVPYLEKLLPEVDRLKSAPMTVSGGNVGIWEFAPFAVRLDLARRRLSTCRAGDPVKESLMLLAYERNSDDSGLIEKHLRAASDLTAFQAGLHALHATAPSRARSILNEVLLEVREPDGKARILRVAALLGVDIEMRIAFECALADYSSMKLNAYAEFSFQQLISDVLAKFALPPDLVEILEKELPTSTRDRRSRLWQMANSCKSLVIAEYAATRLKAQEKDLGNTCNYFIGQPELAHTRKQELIECCEQIFSDEENWFLWSTGRVLALIGMLGFTEKAAASLSAMIQCLVRVRGATEQGDVASLSSKEAALLKSTKPEHIRFHLDDLAAQLIPAAAQARMLLSDETLLSLMYFDAHTRGVVEHQRELLSGISDEEIDEMLTKVEDSWTRITGLVAVCPRGATDTRIKLLADEIRRGYAHPAVMKLICQATEACWCEAIFEMIVSTVSEIPIWSEQDSQFFWEFSRMVAQHVDSSSQFSIERALSTAQTAFAVRILELWRDHALDTRIGLARVPSV